MPELLAVVAGMCVGADSIDDLDALRAGGMLNRPGVTSA